MSRDFYVCDDEGCGEVFEDANDGYAWICKCGNVYCWYGCGGLRTTTARWSTDPTDEPNDVPDSCSYCRHERFTTEQVLDRALSLLGTTRTDLETMMVEKLNLNVMTTEGGRCGS